MPGMGEWLVILIIVLLVFGANKLPSIGDALGRSIKNFKRASAGDDVEAEDPAPKKKQVSAGTTAKQIEDKGQTAEAAADDDDEWEEVVVRRRKKKPAAGAEEA